MREPSNWGEDLRAIDARLAEVPLPDDLEARIVAAAGRASPVESRPRPAKLAIAVAVAFAAGVLLTLAWTHPRPAPQPELTTRDESIELEQPALADEPTPVASPVASPGPGLLASADCEWSRVGERVQLASGCRLQLAEPALELEAWAPTSVRTIDGGLELIEGVAAFAVEHRADPRSPAKIAVSGGTIEILGTRFVIEQREAGGHVDLISGAIAFRDLDGAVEAVEAGRRHHWRTPTTEPAALAPTPSEHERKPGPATDRTDIDTGIDTDTRTQDRELAEVLAEVARLRHAGAYAEAIARLDALAEGSYPQRTREVISYERATLVERADTPALACASWAAHRRRFVDGRYEADIERRMRALDCEASE